MEKLKKIIYIGIVVYVIYMVNNVQHSTTNNKVESQPKEVLLKDYIEEAEEKRASISSKIAIDLNISNEDGIYFKNCLGDYAFIKNPELPILQIASWCKDESLLKREKFENHYNETKNKEVKTFVRLKCQEQLIEKYQLPSNASFPFFENFYTNHKRGEWSVRSSVSANDVEKKWSCRAKIKNDIFYLEKIELQ